MKRAMVNPNQQRICTPISLTPDRLKTQQSQLLAIDVRTGEEYASGHIPGAQNLSREQILQTVPKHQPLVVTCLSGKRSREAAHWLVDRGYQKVYSLEGGCRGWQQAGYELQNQRDA